MQKYCEVQRDPRISARTQLGSVHPTPYTLAENKLTGGHFEHTQRGNRGILRDILKIPHEMRLRVPAGALKSKVTDGIHAGAGGERMPHERV